MLKKVFKQINFLEFEQKNSKIRKQLLAVFLNMNSTVPEENSRTFLN